MKICFIGNCGHSFQTYNEMKECPEAKFVGIAPGSEHENIDSFQKFGIKIFSSYLEMIEKTSPDIAVISPVFGITGKIIKECAERKIDIFSEKPIASTLKELDEVKNAVVKNGIHFSAMHFLRFVPAFYHAQKAVENGEIGDVRLITAQKSYKFGNRPYWYSDRRLYTGTIPWVGIHAIDWIYFFSKKEFISVKAIQAGHPEKTALCQFELSDNVIASVNIDYLRPDSAPTHSDDRIRVVGSKGIVEVFDDRFILMNDKGVKEFSPKTSPKLAYDFLYNKEELKPDEIFTVCKASLLARESADKNIFTKII